MELPQLKVAQHVVLSVAINVMDGFVPMQATAKMFRYHEPMFQPLALPTLGMTIGVLPPWMPFPHADIDIAGLANLASDTLGRNGWSEVTLS